MQKLLQLNKRLFVALIMAYLLAFSIYGYWDYTNTREDIMAGIDKDLYNSAVTLKFVLPEDFHDRAVDPDAIPIEEDMAIADKLTRLIRETGFKYAYTIIKKNGSLFFIAADITADPGTKRGTFYFYRYKEADESFFKAFNQKKPTYKTVTDQWGTVRTVMIPEQSVGGVPFLACLDHDISHVKELLQKNLIESILAYLLLILLAIPIIIVYVKLHVEYSESLRESEHRFDLAMNATRDGLWDWDLVTNEIYYSPSWKKMLGFDYDELPNDFSVWENLTSPEDVERSWKMQQELIGKKRDRFEIEFRMKHKDGHWVDILSRANAFFDKGGKAVRIVGTHVDITNRKKTEEASKESERKYRLLADNATDVIWSLDMDLKFTYISPSVEKLRGYTPEEAINIPLEQTFTTASYHKVIQIISGERKRDDDPAVQANRSIVMELDTTHKTGYVVPVEVNASFLRDKTGSPIGIIGITRDITERRLAGKALRESEKKFRNIIERSPMGIHIYQLESDGRLVFVEANPAADSILGLSNKQFIGKTIEEAFPQLIKTDVPETYRRVAKEGITWDTEEIVYKDNQIHGAYHVHAFQTTPGKMVTMFIDITDRKKAEVERENLQIRLAQSQKMEAIGTLAGGIAHDFNNILSGIFGYSQLALSKIDDQVRVKDCISQIDSGAKRAAELVRQILTFSRQDIYQKKPLQLSVATKEALKLLRSSIPTSIEIKKNIFSESTVLADPIKIHQLIINLCTNAYHAIGENNGSITITLIDENIKKPEQHNKKRIPPGHYLILEVTDTGTGMEKSVIEKIFDPYFTTKQVGKGTGLGLALVKAIVKEHEGIITVQSAPGKGTSFFVYFPTFQEKSEHASSSIEEVKHFHGNDRIMIVDDEQAIRDVTGEILKSHGYDVSLFNDGSHALAEFEKDPDKYDLIITDMTMPKMNGDKLAIKILEKNPEIPVLICTGFSETLSEEKASGIGIKKVLNKPLKMNTLLRNIRKILDEKSVLTAQNKK